MRFAHTLYAVSIFTSETLLVSNRERDVVNYIDGLFRSSRFSLLVSFLRDCSHQSAVNLSSTVFVLDLLV